MTGGMRNEGMQEQAPGPFLKRRGIEPQSKAVFLYGADIEPGEGDHLAVFEEKRTSTVAGVAYPTADSRSPAACGRALDLMVDCFLERPSVADIAMKMIGQIIDENIGELQSPGQEFMCSAAGLYIFKGKARVSPIGYAAVLFFEEGEHKGTWYGDGIPAGKDNRDTAVSSEIMDLHTDCRFVFIAGCGMDAVREAAAYFEESKGEDTEGMEAYLSGKHLAYVNLYLPKREKRGFFR